MNKYAHFNRPDAVLDFHELGPVDGSEVNRVCERFLRDSAKANMRMVRIITGKGVHSRGAPLVAPQVRRTVERLRKEGLVADYAPAKVFEGGDGALDVRLD